MGPPALALLETELFDARTLKSLKRCLRSLEVVKPATSEEEDDVPTGLARMFAALLAARLAGVVHRSSHDTLASAVSQLSVVVASLQDEFPPESAPPAAVGALKDVVHAVGHHLEKALVVLDSLGAPQLAAQGKRKKKPRHKKKDVGDKAPKEAMEDDVASGDSAGVPVRVAVRLAAELDAAYYQLYYHGLICGWPAPQVPSPVKYFQVLADAYRGSEDAVAAQVASAGGFGAALLRETWEDPIASESHAERNPLLALSWARWREGASLLHATGLAACGDMDRAEERAPPAAPKGKAKAKAKKRKRKSASGTASRDGTGPPPPCPDYIQDWRDGVRTWPCHLYAYAVPNEPALAALEAVSPLVEAGAGTGYWADLLRQRGVDIVALDSRPPGPGSKSNEYHGHVPAWTDVLAGDAASLENYESHALFLCYPPPRSPMALEHLQAYKGRTVAVVGEWDGDTGSHAFTRSLLWGWVLEKRVALPGWADTSYELTIWKRAGKKATGLNNPKKGGLPLFSCSKCGADGSNAPLFRCTYARDLMYCGSACADAHAAERAERLAMRGIYFRRALSFDTDFKAVNTSVRPRKAREEHGDE